METFIKLMDNKIVSVLFGILVALLGCAGMAGESGIFGFALLFSAICIAVKEVINNQMCFNDFDWRNPVYSLVGSLLMILIWIFV
jgi:hypothetical protein